MTVPDLVLYNAPTSGWGHRVSWLLEEIGAPYKLETIDFDAKPSYYFTKINPTGLVPVLQLGTSLDSSLKIPESSVIIELVADLYPASGILPKDPIERAQGRYFAERFNQLIWSKIPILAVKGDPTGAPAFLAGIEELQSLLARHPGTFLLGDKFTLGDIAIGGFVGRLYAFAEAGLLTAGGIGEALLKDGKYAAFKAYGEAIAARPAFERTFPKEKIVELWKGRQAAAQGTAKI